MSKAMWNWLIRYAALAFLAMGIVIGGAIANPWRGPAMAQLPPVLIPRVPIDSSMAQQIYAQLPDLPLENQYISRQTGDRAEESTLVRRLITYHLLVKGRPPFYRLDWKLTLADYLGANELMFQNAYPGASELRTNPIQGDRAVIASMSRQEREDLVRALVNAFNPDYAELEEASVSPGTSSTAPVLPEAEPSPQSSPMPNHLPALPQPGDADLLRF
jgi:hypothetical protein